MARVDRERAEVFYDKTYDQIWKWFSHKHVGAGKLSEHEAWRLHVKWKQIAAEV